MPRDYFIFGCFALTLYFYINQNNRFRSTASAIRSVFTGECRMACRQSQASGFSGLSSLEPGPSRDYDLIGPNCICQSCPCQMIEQFIRTCSPVTRTYTIIIAMLSQMYCSIIASINEAYEYVARVVRCRLACRKPNALPNDIVETTNYDSNENFGFNREKDETISMKNADKPVTGIKSSMMKLKEKIKSKTSIRSTRSIGIFFKELVGGKTSEDSDADTSKPEKSTRAEGDPKASTSSEAGACPKCVEKGDTCLRECPNAKK